LQNELQTYGPDKDRYNDYFTVQAQLSLSGASLDLDFKSAIRNPQSEMRVS
jgi:hypothetical protein